MFEICKYISLGDLSVYVQYICRAAHAGAWKHIREQRNRNKPPVVNIRRFVEENRFRCTYPVYKCNYEFDLLVQAINLQVCNSFNPKYDTNICITDYNHKDLLRAARKICSIRVGARFFK